LRFSGGAARWLAPGARSCRASQWRAWQLLTDAVEKGFGSILVSLDVALMIAARRW